MKYFKKYFLISILILVIIYNCVDMKLIAGEYDNLSNLTDAEFQTFLDKKKEKPKPIVISKGNYGMNFKICKEKAE